MLITNRSNRTGTKSQEHLHRNFKLLFYKLAFCSMKGIKLLIF